MSAVLPSPGPGEIVRGFFDPAFFDPAFFDTGEITPHRAGHGDAIPLPYRTGAKHAASPYYNEMSRDATEWPPGALVLVASSPSSPPDQESA